MIGFLILFAIEVMLGFLCWRFLFSKPKPDIKVNKQAILVTGAASGIGQRTAKTLMEKGCFVFVADINEERLEEIYGGEENARVIPMDVTSQSDVERALEAVEEEDKGLFAIVNSAGIAFARKHNVFKSVVEENVDEEASKVIGVNLLGTMRVNNVFHKIIKKTSKDTGVGGVYCNIASVAGRCAAKCMGTYAASKHGIEGYSKSLRMEMQPYNIRVVVIEPGFMATPMVTTTFEAKIDLSQTVYPEAFSKENLEKMIDKIKTSTNDPQMVADEIVRCLFTANLHQTHVVVDKPIRKIAFTIGSLLPQPIFDRLHAIISGL